MNIKILGTGCANCRKLYETSERAVKELNIDARIEKVETIPEIMKYGVMRTPALVINDKVKVSGRIPSLEEIKSMILENSI